MRLQRLGRPKLLRKKRPATNKHARLSSPILPLANHQHDVPADCEEGKRADLVLLDANPLEDIANARQISGVMVQGRYFDRSDLDMMLDLIEQDHESFKTNNSIAKVAYPIVVVLLLVAVVLFVVRRVRRRKASQVSS